MASTEEDTTANFTTLSTTFETSSSKLDITRLPTSYLPPSPCGPCNHEPLVASREELEKRQLLHRIELLKLELSQRTLLIDTLRKEQSSQVYIHKHTRVHTLTHLHVSL